MVNFIMSITKSIMLRSGFAVLMLIFSAVSQAQKSVTFESSDKVTVTGDVYLSENVSAPFIILFHQAYYSRGEYLEIAPKLNAMGYNAIAIDQRFGKRVNDVENATFADAKEKNLPRKHRDAYPDLEAALEYVKTNYDPDTLIIWGSSYSAALSLVLAAKHEEIDAALLFSPGEYFKFEGKRFAAWASDVKAPVFLTSSKKEAKKRALIFAELTNPKSVQFKPSFSGFHGSKALWEENAGHEKYWAQVSSFLQSIK